MIDTQTTNGQTSVDLTKAETIICEKCDNRLFLSSFVIKKLSAIVSPSGQEAIIPIQVYSCGNCGQVPKMFEEELARV